MQANIRIEVRVTIIGLHKSGLNKTQISEETGLNQGQYESYSESSSDNSSLQSEVKAKEARNEDDTLFDGETTDDAEVTRHQDGESSSSSSSSSGSTENQENPGNKMTGKLAYGQPNNRVPFKGPYNGPLTFLDTQTKERKEQMALFTQEMAAGDPADLIGQNQHVRQAHVYDDLGRRSMSRDSEKTSAENEDYLTPEKAPPELVMLVAKESALLGPGKDADFPSDFDVKKVLRSGDYWNGVWKEEVQPKSALRSGTQKKNLGSIKAKINEGTELYKVVSKLKDMSPKLLYIINKKQL